MRVGTDRGRHHGTCRGVRVGRRDAAHRDRTRPRTDACPWSRSAASPSHRPRCGHRVGCGCHRPEHGAGHQAGAGGSRRSAALVRAARADDRTRRRATARGHLRRSAMLPRSRPSRHASTWMRSSSTARSPPTRSMPSRCRSSRRSTCPPRAGRAGCRRTNRRGRCRRPGRRVPGEAQPVDHPARHRRPVRARRHRQACERRARGEPVATRIPVILAGGLTCRQRRPRRCWTSPPSAWTRRAAWRRDPGATGPTDPRTRSASPCSPSGPWTPRRHRPNTPFGPDPGPRRAPGGRRRTDAGASKRDFGGRFVPETLMAALVAARGCVRGSPAGPGVLGRASTTSWLTTSDDRRRCTGRTGSPWPCWRRPAPAQPPVRAGEHARSRRRPRCVCTSSARTSPIPAPTRSTTHWARRLLTRRLGKSRVIAETGAGQHGVATATACALLELPCVVFMGEEDIQRQAPNVLRMRALGAEVRSVTSGTATLKDAVNEAMRDWVTNVTTTHYVLGSAMGPHPYPTIVRDLQRRIGDEAAIQLRERRRAAAGHGARLCRRWLQRHRAAVAVHRRAGDAPRRWPRRRATAWRPVATRQPSRAAPRASCMALDR